MKFSSVYIEAGDGKWNVRFKDIQGERFGNNIEPSALGYYHYPRKMGKKKAFNALRDAMVRRHEIEIRHLLESWETLKALTMEK